MKKSLISIVLLSFAFMAHGQDLSVDQAMEAMKSSATEYLKGKYTKVDATATDQYVDATVTKVYSFQDYSYGNLLNDFAKYVKSKKVGLGHSNLQAEIIREIDYAQSHQTEIAAYSALVDYAGKTKFGETVNMTSLFFFDWKGQPIAVRHSEYDRDGYRNHLAKVMEKKVIGELCELKDPMFFKEIWVSDPVYSNYNNTATEYTLCLILDRGESPDGKSGPYTMLFYCFESGNVYSKSVTCTKGRFSETENGIDFGYKKTSTLSYLVKTEYKRTFEIGDFSEIDPDLLDMSSLLTIMYSKQIKKSNSIPEVWEVLDDTHRRISVPYTEEVFTLTKVN